MKKLKRFLGILITMICAVSAVGCSGEKSNNDDTESTLSTDTAAVTESTLSAETVSNKETSEYFSEFDLNDSYTDITAEISLNDNSTNINGKNAAFSDGKLSVTGGGTFLLSGKLSDGQIYVNAGDENVQLVFNGVEISNNDSSPVYIEQAKNTSITLADGSKNILSDGTSYTFKNADENEPDAVIFSKDDLSINGSGSLEITAKYNEGITTKNDLRIADGCINIVSVGNAIKGKDSVAVRNAAITVNSQEDGIKTSNAKEADKGYIYFESGTFNITALNDAVQAEKKLTVIDGEFNLKTGNGADSVQNKQNIMPAGGRMDFENKSNTEDETTESQKGFKAGDEICINGGTITTDCVDDSIHSAGNININNGEISLKSGDDGIHSDSNVTINNGNISIEKSYEGIEGIKIVLNNGNVNIIADDDGLNASDGSANSSDPMAVSPDCVIDINGGNLTVNAGGDGIDSNGTMNINGGITIVEGPENDGNSALDTGSDIFINDGTVIALGSSGMLETPSSSSKQNTIVAVFEQQTSGSEISVKDENDKTIASYTPSKKYSSAIISCPEIETGKEYSLSTGENNTVDKITISDTITTYGNVPSNPMGGGGRENKGDFDKNFGNRQIPTNENGEFERPEMPESGFENHHMPENGEFEPPEMPDGVDGENNFMTPPNRKNNIDGNNNQSEV